MFTLCDIWLPRSIPAVFASHAPKHTHSAHGSGPFVSPVPSHPSPVPMQLPSPPTSPNNGPNAGDAFDEHDPAANAANLRGFVIDVLKRSRTTTSVFQTALCYIEAIRSRIPDLAASEAAGCGPRETDQSDRIVLAADIGYVEEDTDDDDALPPLMRETFVFANFILCTRLPRFPLYTVPPSRLVFLRIWIGAGNALAIHTHCSIFPSIII